jgi:hypothetical protein
MHPPSAWTKKWAYENPRQALVVLVIGVALSGYGLWVILTGP